MSKRQKAEPEFVPKVLEGWDDEPFSFAFVPNQIEANDKYDPQLIGFPLDLLFAGISYDLQNSQESLIHVCYEPAPETYQENSERKEMRYFTTPTNGFSVRVIFDKKTGRWQTEKYNGDKVVRRAVGSTFDKAMLHTTMDGPEADES